MTKRTRKTGRKARRPQQGAPDRYMHMVMVTAGGPLDPIEPARAGIFVRRLGWWRCPDCKQIHQHSLHFGSPQLGDEECDVENRLIAEAWIRDKLSLLRGERHITGHVVVGPDGPAKKERCIDLERVEDVVTFLLTAKPGGTGAPEAE